MYYKDNSKGGNIEECINGQKQLFVYESWRPGVLLNIISILQLIKVNKCDVMIIVQFLKKFDSFV